MKIKYPRKYWGIRKHPLRFYSRNRNRNRNRRIERSCLKRGEMQ